MSVRQVRRWFGVGLVILVVCCQQSFGAGQDVATCGQWIRENNQDIKLTLYLSPGQMVLYSDQDNCSDTAHRTSQGNGFPHLHISSLPTTGKDQDGNDHTVTIGKIDAYHNANSFQRSQYTAVATTNQQKYNCHGYAFGITTWIQNPDAIYNDDYEGGSKSDPTPLINRMGSGDEQHSAKITAIATGSFGIKWVTQSFEKDGDSKVYRGNWAYWSPNDYPDSLSLYKKK